MKYQHGTCSAYSHDKCRCDLCKAAQSARLKSYAERNKVKLNANKRAYYRREKANQSPKFLASVARQRSRLVGRSISNRVHTWKRYGIKGMTWERYLLMLEQQEHKCAICGFGLVARSSTPERDPRVAAVDHDHDTGEPRGLLCKRCNGALGSLDDDVDRLARAIHYLNKFKGVDYALAQ